MKFIIGILAAILISGCTCSSNIQNRLNQDYLSDLGSENNRLAGDLSLDYFNQDLSNLTYDYYIAFITKNEAPSAKGFSTLVKNADSHYFKAQKELFVLALYYKNENTIICDNSNTAFLDSVKTYTVNDTVPDLSKFVMKLISK
ncbi:MAG: hypothetical protein M0P61_07685 [Ignavibacteriaceae bacterium]|nr:hypothetical protein [Ignavibacteriaceae bacterium]